MIRRVVLALLVVAALAACRSAVPPAAEPSGATGANSTNDRKGVEAQQARDPRAEVGALLDAAQDAVVAGELEEFHDCEAAIFQALHQSPEIASQYTDGRAYLADVLDELTRLAEQVEDGDVGEEPPRSRNRCRRSASPRCNRRRAQRTSTSPS